MRELDLFIPFAKAGQDGTLNIVRTTFVDVANLSLKNFHVHMTKVGTSIALFTQIRTLYRTLINPFMPGVPKNGTLINRVGPDHMLHNAASDQGLHCLH